MIKVEKNDISFIGYNDGKAICTYNCICLFWPTLISFICSITLTVFAIVYSMFYLLSLWILFIICIFAILLNFLLIGYNDKVYLKGLKTKHVFQIRKGLLFKDGVQIKNTKAIRIYKFRKSLMIVLKKSYYRIPNESFDKISRDDFLHYVSYHHFTHRVQIYERVKCPCCGYYTLGSKGMYEICSVCFWEDSDEIDDINEFDECNKISLSEARKNFLLYGACSKDLKKYVRKPRDYEKLD